MNKSTAGLLNALMLVATGLGSFFFGMLADAFGRKRALIYSILTFTIFTFLSGLATSVAMLAVCRFVIGFGMGGECIRSIGAEHKRHAVFDTGHAIPASQVAAEYPRLARLLSGDPWPNAPRRSERHPGGMGATVGVSVRPCVPPVLRVFVENRGVLAVRGRVEESLDALAWDPAFRSVRQAPDSRS